MVTRGMDDLARVHRKLRRGNNSTLSLHDCLGDARQGVSCYIPAGEIPVAVGKKRAGSSMSLGQWQQPPRPRSKEGDERLEDFEGVGFEADMFSFHADIHASELQTIPGGNACDICTLSTRV